MIALREYYETNDKAKTFQEEKGLSDEQLQIYIGLLNRRDPLPVKVQEELKNIMLSDRTEEEKDELTVNILIKWVKENIK